MHCGRSALKVDLSYSGNAVLDTIRLKYQNVFCNQFVFYCIVCLVMARVPWEPGPWGFYFAGSEPSSPVSACPSHCWVPLQQLAPPISPPCLLPLQTGLWVAGTDGALPAYVGARCWMCVTSMWTITFHRRALPHIRYIFAWQYKGTAGDTGFWIGP